MIFYLLNSKKTTLYTLNIKGKNCSIFYSYIKSVSIRSIKIMNNMFKVIITFSSLFLIGCAGVKYTVISKDILTQEETLTKSGCASICADIMGGKWCEFYGQIVIGQCIEHKDKNDYKKLLELIKRLNEQAKAGNAEAQFNLGAMYYKGFAVKQNFNKAFKWFLLSAKQGNSLAQNAVGLMSIMGKGVKKDYDFGRYWIQLGAKNGDPNSVELYNDLLKYERQHGRDVMKSADFSNSYEINFIQNQ